MITTRMWSILWFGCICETYRNNGKITAKYLFYTFS